MSDSSPRLKAKRNASMALAQSSKKKEGSRQREPKRPEWSQGDPKKSGKHTGDIAGKEGWTDTQIEAGGARDESSCLRVGSMG